MRIFDAYENIKIRSGFKTWLLAEGLTIGRVDRTYTRFGTYLSRIRGVNYDKVLARCLTEEEFRKNLHTIFYEKWKNHMGYPEIPPYFFHYLNYLHYLLAKDPTIVIDGLNRNDENVEYVSQLGEYELKFTHNGKLSILSHPALVRKVRFLVADGDNTEAVATCKKFYADCALQMTDDDWEHLLEAFQQTPKKSTAKSAVRNIRIVFPDGLSGIFSGPEAFIRVARTINPEELKRCNVKHRAKKILTKDVPAGSAAYFKPFDDDWYINLSGSTTDKYKTLCVLNSLYQLF